MGPNRLALWVVALNRGYRPYRLACSASQCHIWEISPFWEQGPQFVSAFLSSSIRAHCNSATPDERPRRMALRRSWGRVVLLFYIDSISAAASRNTHVGRKTIRPAQRQKKLGIEYTSFGSAAQVPSVTLLLQCLFHHIRQSSER